MSSLFRKYRPTCFANVAEQHHVVMTLSAQILRNSFAQVYLFSGPRGVGKTTIARLFAKSLQCKHREETSAEACGTCSSCLAFAQGAMLDIIEIDAASQTGVDAVRENILEGVRFPPSLGKYKVFIIDEVHMLSTASFNALLKTLEEPPAFAMFILATTELHKIPATVLSRCQRFVFTRIPLLAMHERLTLLVRAEKREVEDGVLRRIAQLSEGCLRDAESLLGQVLECTTGVVYEEHVRGILPDSPLSLIVKLSELLAQGDVASAAQEARKASESGASMRHVGDVFLEYVQQAVFFSLGAQSSDIYDEHTQRSLALFAEALGYARLVALLDALLAARMRQAPALLPELPLQIAFFTWAQPHVSPPKDPLPAPVIPLAKKIPESTSETPSIPHEEAPLVQKPSVVSVSQEEKVSVSPVPTSSWLYTENIRQKWGRCIEKAKEAGPGYALMVGGAMFDGIENEKTIRVAFSYEMHKEKMQDPKNAKILLSALKEICLLPDDVRLLMVKKAQSQEEVQKEVADLAEAFGGSIVG